MWSKLKLQLVPELRAWCRCSYQHLLTLWTFKDNVNAVFTVKIRNFLHSNKIRSDEGSLFLPFVVAVPVHWSGWLLPLGSGVPRRRSGQPPGYRGHQPGLLPAAVPGHGPVSTLHLGQLPTWGPRLPQYLLAQGECYLYLASFKFCLSVSFRVEKSMSYYVPNK